MAGTCCHRCGHVHEKGTSCPKPYLTGAKSCKNRANEGMDEMFVAPRQHQTYMPDEWNYPLLVQLFDKTFGLDLQDEIEGKIVMLSDLKRILDQYGATHFQSKDISGKPILPRLVKMLQDKGHIVYDGKEAFEETNEEKIKGSDGKPCWKGYRYAGTENGKDKCIPVKEELDELNEGEFCPACLAEYIKEHWNALQEAEYRGRNVPLGKPMQGDVKKFKVYVKDPKTGNVKKVNFGDPNMRIKKSNPARRKSFRARHNCDNPGPRTKARYWSCRKW